MEIVSSFSVLRHPQFRGIFLAQSTSLLGDNVAPIALAFAVLAATHSATDLGLVLAARTLPLAIFVIIGGAWADRLPRKGLMVTSDVARLATQAVLAILLFRHVTNVWAFVLLQAGNGAATAFFRPAASGLVQEAVPVDERQSANALLSGANNISSILGPAIAAGLIATIGNAWAIALDAASFGISALFLLQVVVPPRIVQPRTGMLNEIRQGFNAILRQRWLGLQIMGFAQIQFFVLSSYAVLGPLVSERHYAGASTWALVTAVCGVGALLGDFVALRFRPQRPLVAANLISMCCIPLIFSLAFTVPTPVLVASGLLFGLSLSMPNTLWFTAMQNNVPEHLIARVSSFDWMGSTALRPLGLAAVAPLAAAVGPSIVLVVAGSVTFASLSALTLTPSVRHLRSGSRP